LRLSALEACKKEGRKKNVCWGARIFNCGKKGYIPRRRRLELEVEQANGVYKEQKAPVCYLARTSGWVSCEAGGENEI